ncbi:MAG: hypothetical protein WBV40_05240, partial [Candidatus Cybelea sp.]
MRTLARYALSVGVAAALLASCGRSQPPIGAPGSAPQGRAVVAHAERGGSWMLPEAQHRALLYVTAQYYGPTYVYTFPGGKLVGGLSNIGYTYGLCSNANGDVFITDQSEGAIYEYPHGLAKRIAALGDPQGAPYGCSVDSTTGDLAATSGTGVAIYRPAMRHQWHLPRMYNLSPEVLFGGYDGSGNFFVDGKLSGTTPFLYELPKGASGFENVTLNVTLADPGNIEWDGKDLAVGDNQNLLIHRFAISGTQGTQVGSLTLKGASLAHQFWIQGKTLIGPAYESGYYIGLWNYPRGGSHSRT